jgi:hypothetical protein
LLSGSSSEAAECTASSAATIATHTHAFGIHRIGRVAATTATLQQCGVQCCNSPLCSDATPKMQRKAIQQCSPIAAQLCAQAQQRRRLRIAIEMASERCCSTVAASGRCLRRAPHGSIQKRMVCCAVRRSDGALAQ